MAAERLAKNFQRMVITSERLKKFSNGRPKRLNGRSNISNGWSGTAERLVKNFERMVITSERLKKFLNRFSWTAERLVKNFERMVITAEWLKKISNGRPERLNGTSKISNGRPEQLNGSSKISNGWSCGWSQAQAVDVLVGRAKNIKFWLAYFKIISLTSTLPDKCKFV